MTRYATVELVHDKEKSDWFVPVGMPRPPSLYEMPVRLMWSRCGKTWNLHINGSVIVGASVRPRDVELVVSLVNVEEES